MRRLLAIAMLAGILTIPAVATASRNDANDGTLSVRTRGGFILSLFEGKPALIHTGGGADIPGIFLPREGEEEGAVPAAAPAE